MQITDKKVVVLHYAVSDSEDTLIDSSYDHSPLSIIQGTGYLIPGLENALVDHVAGDKFEVEVEAEAEAEPATDEAATDAPDLSGEDAIARDDEAVDDGEAGADTLIAVAAALAAGGAAIASADEVEEEVTNLELAGRQRVEPLGIV